MIIKLEKSFDYLRSWNYRADSTSRNASRRFTFHIICWLLELYQTPTYWITHATSLKRNHDYFAQCALDCRYWASRFSRRVGGCNHVGLNFSSARNFVNSLTPYTLSASLYIGSRARIFFILRSYVFVSSVSPERFRNFLRFWVEPQYHKSSLDNTLPLPPSLLLNLRYTHAYKHKMRHVHRNLPLDAPLRASSHLWELHFRISSSSISLSFSSSRRTRKDRAADLHRIFRTTASRIPPLKCSAYPFNMFEYN